MRCMGETLFVGSHLRHVAWLLGLGVVRHQVDQKGRGRSSQQEDNEGGRWRESTWWFPRPGSLLSFGFCEASRALPINLPLSPFQKNPEGCRPLAVEGSSLTHSGCRPAIKRLPHPSLPRPPPSFSIPCAIADACILCRISNIGQWMSPW